MIIYIFLFFEISFTTRTIEILKIMKRGMRRSVVRRVHII